MSFGNDRATCPAQDYNSRKTVSVQLGIRLKSELRCAIVIGGAARVIEEMPLEYKKTFNPGEHLWPVALKLSQSDVAQRPNTEIVSCKACGEQFGIQNAITAIRPMQQLKQQLEQWLARDHSDERRHQERYEFRF
jgi:hypothetical protein